MAPTRKNTKQSSSSSKATGSIPVKKASAKASKPTKSKASAAAARVPTNVYVLIREEGYVPDGFHSSSPMTTRAVGVYYNENQAYFAGIRHLIEEFERRWGEEKPKLREIAKRRTMSLKKRMAEIVEEGNGPDDEQVDLCVHRSELIPSQTVEEEKVLDDLKDPSSRNAYEDEDEVYRSGEDDDDVDEHYRGRQIFF